MRSLKKKSLDETKFKLKVPNDSPETTPEPDFEDSEPNNQEKKEDSFDLDHEPFDAGVEADEESDPKKYIQQLSGKLGQTLRNYTKENGEPDYDLEKFAINSVISATHTSTMDDEDKEDIIDKVENSGAGEEPEEKTDNSEENVEETLDITENNTKFVDKINFLLENYKNKFDMNSIIDEILETPVVEPTTKPTVKPETKPSRRSKPFKVPSISPEESPKPKAEN